jgi:predicted transcriptional regulator
MTDKFDPEAIEVLRQLARRRTQDRPRAGSGRTAQLNVRVSQELRDDIDRLATEHGLLIAEIIEQAVAAWKEKVNRSGR